MRIFLVSVLLAIPLAAADRDADDAKRIHESALVLSEIMHAGDQGIPDAILHRAQCVGVIPNLKRAGFIVGAKYGKGVITCRVPEGTGWSAPAMEVIDGGSVGFQIGLGETDVVFAVMNQSGMNKLMADKFTIGADASVMAGPVGRSTSADTDALMAAEILSWSRSHGIFAGVSLQGATIRADNEDNRKLYGRDVTTGEILHGKVPPPPEAQGLYDELNRYAPFKKGE